MGVKTQGAKLSYLSGVDAKGVKQLELLYIRNLKIFQILVIQNLKD
jgi:hypothetical protein